VDQDRRDPGRYFQVDLGTNLLLVVVCALEWGRCGFCRRKAEHPRGFFADDLGYDTDLGVSRRQGCAHAQSRLPWLLLVVRFTSGYFLVSYAALAGRLLTGR